MDFWKNFLDKLVVLAKLDDDEIHGDKVSDCIYSYRVVLGTEQCNGIESHSMKTTWSATPYLHIKYMIFIHTSINSWLSRLFSIICKLLDGIMIGKKCSIILSSLKSKQGMCILCIISYIINIVGKNCR